MRVGVILKSGDVSSLYVGATYIATELARGVEVVVFVTGEAILAFAKRNIEGGPLVERMKRFKVHWPDLLEAAKPLGLRIYACETAAKLYDVGELELVDEVTSMYTFLEGVDSVVVF